MIPADPTRGLAALTDAFRRATAECVALAKSAEEKADDVHRSTDEREGLARLARAARSLATASRSWANTSDDLVGAIRRGEM